MRRIAFLAVCCFLLGPLSFAADEDIQTLILLGNWSMAQKECRAVLDSGLPKEKKEKAQFYLGLVNFKLKHFAEGRSNFTAFLNEFPESRYANQARMCVADIYLNEGSDSLAEKIYLELLETQDKKIAPAVYSRLIELNLKRNDRAKAQEYLSALHSQYPQSFEAAKMKALPEEVVVNNHAASDPDFFTVQVGAFAEKERADKLCAELNEKGEAAYIVSPQAPGKNPLYRVRVGKFVSSDDAEDLAGKLSAQGYPTKIFP
ncbi:MAG: SPOR domain-containing protein [Candidatus Omnitrophota bacterium]